MKVSYIKLILIFVIIVSVSSGPNVAFSESQTQKQVSIEEKIEKLKANITLAKNLIQDAKDKCLQVDIKSAENYLNESKGKLKLIDEKKLVILQTDFSQDRKDATKVAMKEESNKIDEAYLRSLIDEASNLITRAILNTIQPTALETRAIWTHPNYHGKDETAIRDSVRKLKEANFNLIFPLMFYHGYTFYPSKVATEYGVPAQYKVFEGIDPLQILIDEAHKNGMEVHVWYCVFYVGTAKENLLIYHPEWSAVDKKGNSLCYNGECHADPAIPGVREYLTKLMVEATQKYDVDGIHLDYIRYPGQLPTESSYSTYAREQFKKKYKIDPINIETVAVEDNELADKKKWDDWRKEQVTSFVEEVYKSVKAVKKDVKLSAAIFPQPELVLQDWEKWVKKGIIDFFAPMNYTADWRMFRNVNESMTEKINDEVFMAPGIGVYRVESPLELVKQVKVTRDEFLHGVTFFAQVHMKDDAYNILKELPFKKPSVIPHNDLKRTIQILKDEIIARLNYCGEDSKNAVRLKNEVEKISLTDMTNEKEAIKKLLEIERKIRK